MRSMLLLSLFVPVAVAAQRSTTPPAAPPAPAAPITRTAPPAPTNSVLFWDDIARAGVGTQVIYNDAFRDFQIANLDHLRALDDHTLALRDLEFSRIDLARSLDDHAITLNTLGTTAAFEHYTAFGGDWLAGRGAAPVPQAWAQADPADSLYRSARELLNRGDYRRAAAAFSDIPKKFPNSQYNKDAPYWQAFALYRIGGTPELQEALAVLEARKAKYPSAVRTAQPGATSLTSNGNLNTQVYYTGGQPGTSSTDADVLAARIAGVLSNRGLGNTTAVRNALAANPNSCDNEEQSVRAEALSVLMQSDPEQGRALATRILARRDECSISLRRNAIYQIGSKKDAAAATALIGVAKSDPSADLRAVAADMLGQMPGEEALATLEELSRGTDERLQRTAVRVLASHPNPSARSRMRALIERNDANEALRLTALDAYDRGERASAEDATWLRNTYPRITSTRVRERIVSIVGRIGGDANDQFLTALMRNDEETVEARMSAIRRLGSTMDITALGKLYDAASQRQIREAAISVLASRKEPEAADKLVDIAKNATDPSLRRYAISALARSSDPRKNKMLLDLVDR